MSNERGKRKMGIIWERYWRAWRRVLSWEVGKFVVFVYYLMRWCSSWEATMHFYPLKWPRWETSPLTVGLRLCCSSCYIWGLRMFKSVLCEGLLCFVSSQLTYALCFFAFAESIAACQAGSLKSHSFSHCLTICHPRWSSFPYGSTSYSLDRCQEESYCF